MSIITNFPLNCNQNVIDNLVQVLESPSHSPDYFDTLRALIFSPEIWGVDVPTLQAFCEIFFNNLEMVNHDCRYCNRKMWRHGHYFSMIFDHSLGATVPIKLQRYLCPVCRYTHTMRPWEIAPRARNNTVFTFLVILLKRASIDVLALFADHDVHYEAAKRALIYYRKFERYFTTWFNRFSSLVKAFLGYFASRYKPPNFGKRPERWAKLCRRYRRRAKKQFYTFGSRGALIEPYLLPERR